MEGLTDNHRVRVTSFDLHKNPQRLQPFFRWDQRNDVPKLRSHSEYVAELDLELDLPDARGHIPRLPLAARATRKEQVWPERWGWVRVVSRAHSGRAQGHSRVREGQAVGTWAPPQPKINTWTVPIPGGKLKDLRELCPHRHPGCGERDGMDKIHHRQSPVSSRWGDTSQAKGYSF